MSDETNKRDILGDILSGPHTEIIKGLDELNKLIHASPAQPASKAARVASAGKKKQKARAGKQKTTHYLTKEVFDNLGEAKADIRDFLPASVKSKASKSGIVESAITVVLQEFEKKGKDSALIQELLKKKDD